MVAYTSGQGTWASRDLSPDAAKTRWEGSIPATMATNYFVQVVDGGGNVGVDDNKGLYYAFQQPLPLAEGSSGPVIYLPLVVKGG